MYFEYTDLSKGINEETLQVISRNQGNAENAIKEAIQEDVAYVIGSAFHCDGSGQNTARLNFSYSSDEQIEEGIKRLGRVVTKNLKKR